MNNNKKIVIYTDGACKGNPGLGGWGVLIEFPEDINELYGFQEDTTNNRMELIAVIEALNSLKINSEIEIVMVFPNICQWMHFTCQRLFTTPITFHSPMEKVAIIFKSITYLDFYFKRQYHPQLDISKDEKDAQHEHEFFRVLYLF